MIGVPDGDGRLANAGHLGLAVGIDADNQLLAAGKLDPVGDIGNLAVGIPGPDDHLQRVARLHLGHQPPVVAQQELEKHAAEELQHALIISKQIDYLGGMPTVTPKPVKTSEKAEDMLRFGGVLSCL